MMHPPPIALLTDFGLDDWYVAAMKGQILSRLPEARLLDISHAVPAGLVESGAFLLRCVRDAMPPGTVFLCVVDPGVGTGRRALVGRIGDYGYAGPDNGLATPLLEVAGGKIELRQIEDVDWRAQYVGSTFHGRDLFAPAAACLAGGWTLEEAGPLVRDPVMLPAGGPAVEPGGLAAHVMIVDHFGNLVTDLEESAWAERLTPGRFTIRAGALVLRKLEPSFGHVKIGGPLAYWGSASTLEVAINRGSAAAAAGLAPGATIQIEWIG